MAKIRLYKRLLFFARCTLFRGLFSQRGLFNAAKIYLCKTFFVQGEKHLMFRATQPALTPSSGYTPTPPHTPESLTCPFPALPPAASFRNILACSSSCPPAAQRKLAPVTEIRPGFSAAVLAAAVAVPFSLPPALPFLTFPVSVDCLLESPL